MHLDPGRLDPEGVGIDAFVAFALPSLTVELLMEVPLGVQQSDADERDAEVGAGLQVVAGEHAESPRVLRQRLGDAEFGREVGDEFERSLTVGAASAEPGRSRECFVETFAAPCDLLDVLLVVGERIPTRWRGAADQIDGMLTGLAPRTAGR